MNTHFSKSAKSFSFQVMRYTIYDIIHNLIANITDYYKLHVHSALYLLCTSLCGKHGENTGACAHIHHHLVPE